MVFWISRALLFLSYSSSSIGIIPFMCNPPYTITSTYLYHYYTGGGETGHRRTWEDARSLKSRALECSLVIIIQLGLFPTSPAHVSDVEGKGMQSILGYQPSGEPTFQLVPARHGPNVSSCQPVRANFYPFLFHSPRYTAAYKTAWPIFLLEYMPRGGGWSVGVGNRVGMVYSAATACSETCSGG